MNSQQTFSFFKNKDIRFDWWTIVFTAAVLLIASFITAWHFMEVTQKTSDDVDLVVNETVTLDKDGFDEVKERFLLRRGSLITILGGTIEGEDSLVSGSQEAGGGDESGEQEDLEDA